jgi:hypothetical protein
MKGTIYCLFQSKRLKQKNRGESQAKKKNLSKEKEKNNNKEERASPFSYNS